MSHTGLIRLTERKNNKGQTVYYGEEDMMVCGKIERTVLFSAITIDGRDNTARAYHRAVGSKHSDM